MNNNDDLLHIVVDLDKIPIDMIQSNLSHIPNAIRAEFSQNHILIFADDQFILEFPTYLLRAYTYRILELTAMLDINSMGQTGIFKEIFFILMNHTVNKINYTIDIFLNKNYTLLISVADELTLEIPAMNVGFPDGVIHNAIQQNPYYNHYQYHNQSNYQYYDGSDTEEEEFIVIPKKKNVSLGKNNIILPNSDESDVILSNDNACKICMDKDVCTINLPCGHLCFCITCCHTYVKENKKECPICKVELIEVKRFYK